MTMTTTNCIIGARTDVDRSPGRDGAAAERLEARQRPQRRALLLQLRDGRVHMGPSVRRGLQEAGHSRKVHTLLFAFNCATKRDATKTNN